MCNFAGKSLLVKDESGRRPRGGTLLKNIVKLVRWWFVEIKICLHVPKFYSFNVFFNQDEDRRQISLNSSNYEVKTTLEKLVRILGAFNEL